MIKRKNINRLNKRKLVFCFWFFAKTYWCVFKRKLQKLTSLGGVVGGGGGAATSALLISEWDIFCFVSEGLKKQVVQQKRSVYLVNFVQQL